MTILSAQSIKRRVGMITPFHERTIENGVSYGLSPAGYDLRIKQTLTLFPGDFQLASTVERIVMPNDLIAGIHDKSTWIRRGLLVGNSKLEPGWEGWVTLELFLAKAAIDRIQIPAGTAICQVVFQRLDEPTEQPYGATAKYQNQPDYPVSAIMEGK